MRVAPKELHAFSFVYNQLVIPPANESGISNQ